MLRHEVSEVRKASMIERHQRGDSFSKIGRDLGIDRRVVARITREDEERQSGRLAVRRNELAQLFHEHRGAMEKVATILLELTASPSLRGSLIPGDPDVESALDAKLPWQFESPEFLLGGEPPETVAEKDLKQRVKWRLGLHKGKAAFQGLREHIPMLEAEIGRWKQVAASYEESWNQLQEQAAGNNVSPDSIEASVKLALERISAFDQEDGIPHFRKPVAATDRVEEFANILLQRPANKRLLKIFSQKLNELNAAYDKLEETLSAPRLDNDLVTGHCRYCPVP